jgi:hypothetical protein
MSRSRFRRRLFNAITALSLTIFLLAPIAWLCSEGQDQGIGRDQAWVDGSTMYAFEDSIEWCDGMLMIERHGELAPNVTPIRTGQWASGPYARAQWAWFTADSAFLERIRFPKAGFGNGVGFYFVWLTEPFDSVHAAAQAYAVGVPLWLITLVSAILPAIWLRRFVLQGDRNRSGHCKNCGYDLRASDGRCPECGEMIAD